jgi:hypothetical protein
VLSNRAGILTPKATCVMGVSGLTMYAWAQDGWNPEKRSGVVAL